MEGAYKKGTLPLRRSRHTKLAEAYLMWGGNGAQITAFMNVRKGSVVPYVWAVAEIAYRCRMRGVEVRNLMQWMTACE
ncbi:hypothetical protein [Dyella sp.]|jgi:hypothetical protein|uniref:hypothetical protein n=1 Tax=Dyella sp. TaxID=1869338 RepID=UPI002FDB7A36